LSHIYKENKNNTVEIHRDVLRRWVKKLCKGIKKDKVDNIKYVMDSIKSILK
jgi:hypothetical protein